MQIFIVATHGEGEPTNNAKQFYRWLQAQTSSDLLKHMQFAVFALGDRNYTDFCAMGRNTERHLLRLGAKAFCPRGNGDDSQDINADWSEWRKSLWPELDKLQAGLPESVLPPQVNNDALTNPGAVSVGTATGGGGGSSHSLRVCFSPEDQARAEELCVALRAAGMPLATEDPMQEL